MSSKKNGEMYRNAIITKTKEYFIEQARKIWGDRYDYTDSEYVNNKKPIIIYCPKHDHHFRVAMAQNHIMKERPGFKPTGCPICAAEKRHGCEYDKDWRKHLKLCTKVNRVGKIESHRHWRLDPEEVARRKAERKAQADAAREQRKAQRWQEYQERLQQQKEQTRLRHEAERQERQRQREEKEHQRILDLQDRFRKEAPLKQGEGYIYKGIEQITSVMSKVMVHCPNPDHQWHPMLVNLCLQGCKCRECAGRHQPKEQRCADFIRKSEKKYKDLFDYSRVPAQYVNNDTPVEIRCLQHNYLFEVTPDTHLRKYGGCPVCNMSKGEFAIFLWLREHGINFKHNQVHLPHHNLFCQVEYLVPDFFLPDLNTIIEYNGEQHYEEVDYFRRDKNWSLEAQQERDRTLRDICRDKHYRLIEIHYKQYNDIPKILSKAFLPNKRHKTE